MNIYLLIPLLIIMIAYILFLVYDILNNKETKFLPWWLWIIVSCLSIPFGGIIYLLIGRD